MTDKDLIEATINGVEIWKDVTILWHGNRKDKTKTTKYNIKSKIQVSNLGRLRKHTVNRRVLLLVDSKTGPTEHLRNKLAVIERPERKFFQRHQIVMQTFFPNSIPEVIMIDHIDRNPLNNKVTNLRWTTFKKNNNNRAHMLSEKTRLYIESLEREIVKLRAELALTII